MQTYTIQPGDTLSTLAAKYGTTVSALAAANGISNPNMIRVGASLKIPSVASGAAPAATGAKGTPVTLGNGTTVYVQSNGTFTDANGNPVQNSAVSASTAGTSSTAAPGSSSSTITLSSTGNDNLDNIQNSLIGVANNLISTGYTIPTSLQVTPALVSDFLSYAHQAVDPYTQQLMSSEIGNVNADLQNQQKQFELKQGQTEQDFGVQLASQDNAAGNAGVAMSGQRQLTDNNLVNSTNRSLASLGASAAYNAGNSLRTGAANVGSAAANQFNLPTFAGDTVGLGGQYGRTNANATGAAPLNYNPSLYTSGAYQQQGTINLANQYKSYTDQYGQLANAQSNSGRSISDLIGMIPSITSLPNYQPPTNLK